MHLSTESLACFVGGQLEVQNQNEGYIYRGEIETVVVEDSSIKIRFTWLAKGKGFPPQGWINHANLDYLASTTFFQASDAGGNRIAMSSTFTGEIAVFFPPDGSKLAPSKVEGLELKA